MPELELELDEEMPLDDDEGLPELDPVLLGLVVLLVVSLPSPLSSSELHPAHAANTKVAPITTLRALLLMIASLDRKNAETAN